MSDKSINFDAVDSWEQKFSKSGTIYIKCKRCGFEIYNMYHQEIKTQHEAEFCDKWIAGAIMKS